MTSRHSAAHPAPGAAPPPLPAGEHGDAGMARVDLDAAAHGVGPALRAPSGRRAP